MKIAYLGPNGSFTEIAAKDLFKNAEFIPMQPIRKIIQAVESESVDYGIVPIENLYGGEVIETLDALTKAKETKIIKEKGFEIKHCLGVLQDNKEINQIFSKDQALNQCSKYLCENYPNSATIATQSTTDAIKRIIKENLKDAAAIASEKSLIDSKLNVIAKDLCPKNRTRFVVLGKKIPKQTGNDKTFLTFYPQEKDHPGTLYGNLGFFANLGINLEYIQSRPDGLGGYRFYLELDGHIEDKPVLIALQALKQALDPKDIYQNSIQILGSFKNTDWKNGN